MSITFKKNTLNSSSIGLNQLNSSGVDFNKLNSSTISVKRGIGYSTIGTSFVVG